MSNNCTKENILKVAGELFAKNGYEGTSIREISTAADVNLASVNYHFKNKQNLYIEVMDRNIIDVEVIISRIAGNSKDMKEFAWELLQFFTNSPDMFINSFKLFITNSLPCDEQFIPKTCKANNFGPPGFHTMLELLTKEVGEDIPLKGREWAMRAIFNNIVHIALMLSSSFIKMLEGKVDFLKTEEKKKSIQFQVIAILNFLKENPDKFTN